MSQLLNPVKQKKEVMLMDLVSHRFTTLHVDLSQETEKILYCKKHGGMLYRFFTLGPGWTEKDVRYLAVKGNPLISYIAKEGEPPVNSVSDYLKLVWTEKAYKGLPEALRKSLDEHSVGVTVTVQPFIPKAGDAMLQKAFDDIKAEGILYDADLDNLARMGEAKEVKKWGDKLLDKLPWVLAGIGVTYILQGVGLIKGL